MNKAEKDRNWRILNITCELVLAANSDHTIDDSKWLERGWPQDEIDEAREKVAKDIERIRNAKPN